MGFGKIRVERQALQELALSSGPIPIVVKMYSSERRMSKGQSVVQFQSLHRRRFGFGSRFEWGQIRRIHCGVSFGEAGISKGIVRLEMNGLLKIIERLL